MDEERQERRKKGIRDITPKTWLGEIFLEMEFQTRKDR